MVRMLIVAMLALLFAVPAQAADDVGAAKMEVEAAMQASGAGWNARDVDRFLAVYADGAATTFTTSEGVARGKAKMRERYLRSYPFMQPGSTAPVPQLAFTTLDFRLVEREHALLIAEWRLTAPDGKVQKGTTTLLFHKGSDGWKIVADHSS